MQKALPILLLCLGVAIAGAAGARNGPSHTAYRADLAAGLEVEPPAPMVRLIEWIGVGGPPWLLGMGLIVGGALIARRQLAAANSGEGAEGGRADFPGTVRHALQELEGLAETLHDLPFDTPAPHARERIDRLVAEHLEPLVDRRGQLIARHGLSGFAAYFGLYSSGERNLARCWSALTDGHADAAREALAESQAAFEGALAQWEKIEG